MASNQPLEETRPPWLPSNQISRTFSEDCSHAPSGGMACFRDVLLPVFPTGSASVESSEVHGHTVPHDNCFLFLGCMSWHYYVTMPMPASTFTIAVGHWTEVKPRTSPSDDPVTEHALLPAKDDFRFVFGSLLTSLWECEKLSQNGANWSRERPTGKESWPCNSWRERRKQVAVKPSISAEAFLRSFKFKKAASSTLSFWPFRCLS